MQFHTNLSFSELEITFTSHFMYAGHTYEYLQNISKKTYIVEAAIKYYPA